MRLGLPCAGTSGSGKGWYMVTLDLTVDVIALVVLVLLLSRKKK